VYNSFGPTLCTLRYYLTIQVLSNDNAGKNKSYEKTNSEFVEFVPIPQKLHPFKNPHRLPTEPMGIHHSTHTHTIPIYMGIPMGIPIPTAALVVCRVTCELREIHGGTNIYDIAGGDYSAKRSFNCSRRSVARSGCDADRYFAGGRR